MEENEVLRVFPRKNFLSEARPISLDKKLEVEDLDVPAESRKSSERLLGKPEKESTSNEHRLSVISETCSDR